MALGNLKNVHSQNARRVPPAATAKALAAGIPLVFLAACGASEEANGDALDPDEPLPTEGAEDTTLVIGDQQEWAQVSLEASGELDEFSFDHEFANFDGGPEFLEAFRAGALDVALVGDAPPIHAHVAGEDVPIIFALRSSPNEMRLAVAPGADIDTLDDLEGHRIAYAEGTAQQVMVLAALDEAGLGLDDVELVRLTLDEFGEALQSDAVDVAPLREPRFTRYVEGFAEEGANGIPAEETEPLTKGLRFLYASRESIEDPEKAAALQEFVAHYIESQQWINDNPDEWIDEYFVDNQGLTEEEGGIILESRGLNSFPRLDEHLVAEQQDTVEVLDDADELPAPVEAEEIFELRFNDIIESTVADLDASHEDLN